MSTNLDQVSKQQTIGDVLIELVPTDREWLRPNSPASWCVFVRHVSDRSVISSKRLIRDYEEALSEYYKYVDYHSMQPPDLSQRLTHQQVWGLYIRLESLGWKPIFSGMVSKDGVEINWVEAVKIELDNLKKLIYET